MEWPECPLKGRLQEWSALCWASIRPGLHGAGLSKGPFPLQGCGSPIQMAAGAWPETICSGPGSMDQARQVRGWEWLAQAWPAHLSRPWSWLMMWHVLQKSATCIEHHEVNISSDRAGPGGCQWGWSPLAGGFGQVPQPPWTSESHSGHSACGRCRVPAQHTQPLAPLALGCCLGYLQSGCCF